MFRERPEDSEAVNMDIWGKSLPGRTSVNSPDVGVCLMRLRNSREISLVGSE